MKLLWVLFVACCLVSIEAKKKTAKVEAAPEPTAAAPAEPEKADTETAADDTNADNNADNNSEEDKGEEKEESDAAVEEPKEANKEEKEETSEPKAEEKEESADDNSANDNNVADDNAAAEPEKEQAPEMSCNLKFKRVGCYADNSKKDRPMRSYIMSDSNIGTVSKKGKLPKGEKFNLELPKFACKCANKAIGDGNAIFSLQNLAECWTGPDDSKYDKDGESENCVTFNYAPCDANSAMCAGKKHANFVYFVDTPEHTKTKEEIAKEYEQYKKKVAQHHKKLAAKKKAAKKLKKKSKKAKKE